MKSPGGMVSYFAAAVAREADSWSASEVSLSDAADVEDVADRLRDLSPSADVSLLFVESDDSYLVILRLDQGEDLRVFGSDAAFADESRVGALLLGDVAAPVVEPVLQTVRRDPVGIAAAGPDSAVAAGPGSGPAGPGPTAATHPDRGTGDGIATAGFADEVDRLLGGFPEATGVDDSDADPELAGIALTAPVLGDADPAGDADLLADLGVPASMLLELCGQEGMLPSDITAELCQAIGCGDEVEELREA